MSLQARETPQIFPLTALRQIFGGEQKYNVFLNHSRSHILYKYRIYINKILPYILVHLLLDQNKKYISRFPPGAHGVKITFMTLTHILHRILCIFKLNLHFTCTEMCSFLFTQMDTVLTCSYHLSHVSLKDTVSNLLGFFSHETL